MQANWQKMLFQPVLNNNNKIFTCPMSLTSARHSNALDGLKKYHIYLGVFLKAVADNP